VRRSSATESPILGLRANAAQFTLLVGLNALVGAMVGMERTVLPLVGRSDFGLGTTTAILTFVVAFGLAKATTNLVAGRLSDRVGRKRLLVAGELPVLCWRQSTPSSSRSTGSNESSPATSSTRTCARSSRTRGGRR
jgi:nitrate/nitrite transporter NarK